MHCAKLDWAICGLEKMWMWKVYIGWWKISEKYELMTHCEPYTEAIVSTHVPLGPKWLWLELYVHGGIDWIEF